MSREMLERQPPLGSVERLLWDRDDAGRPAMGDFLVVDTGSLLHLFYLRRYVTTVHADMVSQMGRAERATLLAAVALATRKE